MCFSLINSGSQPDLINLQPVKMRPVELKLYFKLYLFRWIRVSENKKGDLKPKNINMELI